MQRLFSAFPAGWPGAGILLLRAVAAPIVVRAALRFMAAGPETLWGWLFGGMAVISGTCVLFGFMTPPMSTLMGFVVTLVWAAGNPEGLVDGSSALILIGNAAAIALVGPGAFSVDARLFGRREIVLRQNGSPKLASGHATD